MTNRKKLTLRAAGVVCLFFLASAAQAAMSDEDFISLCYRGSAREIYEAIKSGANVNARSAKNLRRTPLMLSTINGGGEKETIAALLMVAGADPWAEDYYGNTFFYYSVDSKATALAREYAQNSGAARDRANRIWREIERAVERERRQKKFASAIEKIEASMNRDPSEKQFETLRQAAETGAAMSQYMLAGAYDKGEGTAKAPAEAVKWYERAAAQGHTMAMNRLGEMYRDGVGVTRNESKAMDLFGRAAEGGYEAARANLADMMSAKFIALCLKGSAEQVKEAIDGGADMNMADGKGYTPLMHAITADKGEIANLLLDRGADAGARDSAGKTALDIAAGKDLRDTELYRRLQVRALQAANKSVDTHALFARGAKAYDAKAYKSAFKSFSEAAEAGHVWASIRLAEMYFNGEGTKKDDGTAFYWMKIGAIEGHARTQYNLAYLYETGQGTAPNKGEALRWYAKAAENGYEAAGEAIADLGGTTSGPVSGNQEPPEMEAIDFSSLETTK
jgi:TPR repeat protein